MTSWSECSVSVFLSLTVGIMAAAPPMLAVWQCYTGNDKWGDYPAEITEKLDAVHNDHSTPAKQGVEYVWKGDGDLPDLEYHILPKPVRVHFK